MRATGNWMITGLSFIGISLGTPALASEHAWGVSGGAVTPGPESGFKDAGVFAFVGDLETDSRWTAGAMLGWQRGRGPAEQHVDITGIGARFGRSFRSGSLRVHPTAGLALYRERRVIRSTIVGLGSFTSSSAHLSFPLAMALEWSLMRSWRIGARETAHVLLDGLSVVDGVEATSTWFSTELVLSRVMGGR